MTGPGNISGELGAVYVSVVPSLAGMSSVIAKGAEQHAKDYTKKFSEVLESTNIARETERTIQRSAEQMATTMATTMGKRFRDLLGSEMLRDLQTPLGRFNAELSRAMSQLALPTGFSDQAVRELEKVQAAHKRMTESFRSSMAGGAWLSEYQAQIKTMESATAQVAQRMQNAFRGSMAGSAWLAEYQAQIKTMETEATQAAANMQRQFSGGMAAGAWLTEYKAQIAAMEAAATQAMQRMTAQRLAMNEGWDNLFSPTARFGRMEDTYKDLFGGEGEKAAKQFSEGFGKEADTGFKAWGADLARSLGGPLAKLAPLFQSHAVNARQMWDKAFAEEKSAAGGKSVLLDDVEKNFATKMGGLSKLATASAASAATAAAIVFAEIWTKNVADVVKLGATEAKAFAKVGAEAGHSLMDGFQDIVEGKMPNVMGAFNVLEDYFKTIWEAPQNAFNTFLDMTIGHIPLLGGAIKGLVGEVESALNSVFPMFDELKNVAGQFLGVIVDVGQTWQEFARTIAGQSLGMENLKQSLDIVREVGLSAQVLHFKDVGQVVGELTQRLSGLGNGAGLTKGQLKELSMTVAEGNELLGNIKINVDGMTAAFNQFNIAPSKVNATMIEFINLSRMTGADINELFHDVEAAGPAFMELGYSMDQVGLMMAKVNQELGKPAMQRTMLSMRGLPSVFARENLDPAEGMKLMLTQLHSLIDMYGVGSKEAAAFLVVNQLVSKSAASTLVDAVAKNIIRSPGDMQKWLDNLKEGKDGAAGLNSGLEKSLEATKGIGDNLEIISTFLKSALAPLGEGLYGSLVEAGNKVISWLKDNQEKLITWAGEATIKVVSTTSHVLEVLSNIISKTGPAVQSFAQIMVTTMLQVDTILANILKGLSSVPDQLWKLAGATVGGVTGGIAGFFTGGPAGAMAGGVTGFGTGYQMVPDHLSGALGGLGDSLASAEGPLSELKGLDINKALQGVSKDGKDLSKVINDEVIPALKRTAEAAEKDAHQRQDRAKILVGLPKGSTIRGYESETEGADEGEGDTGGATPSVTGLDDSIDQVGPTVRADQLPPPPSHGSGGPTLNSAASGYMARMHPNEWVSNPLGRKTLGDAFLAAADRGTVDTSLLPHFDKGGQSDGSMPQGSQMLLGFFKGLLKGIGVDLPWLGKTQGEPSSIETMLLPYGRVSSSSTSARSLPGAAGPGGDAKSQAMSALLAAGYKAEDFPMLDYIFGHESTWNTGSINKSDSNWQKGDPSVGMGQLTLSNYQAYMGLGGRPTADEVMSFTPYQQTSAALAYMKSRYGGLQGAYQHWLANHNYAYGGLVGGYCMGGGCGDPSCAMCNGGAVPGFAGGGGTGASDYFSSGRGDDVQGVNSEILGLTSVAHRFGLKLTAGRSGHGTHQVDGGFHDRGQAGDFSNGYDTPEESAFARLMAGNYKGSILELIHEGQGWNTGYNVYRGKFVKDMGGGVYDAGTLAGHHDHVHVAMGSPVPADFAGGAATFAGATGSSGVWGQGGNRSRLGGYFGHIAQAISSFFGANPNPRPDQLPSPSQLGFSGGGGVGSDGWVRGPYSPGEDTVFVPNMPKNSWVINRTQALKNSTLLQSLRNRFSGGGAAGTLPVMLQPGEIVMPPGGPSDLYAAINKGIRGYDTGDQVGDQPSEQDIASAVANAGPPPAADTVTSRAGQGRPGTEVFGPEYTPEHLGPALLPYFQAWLAKNPNAWNPFTNMPFIGGGPKQKENEDKFLHSFEEYINGIRESAVGVAKANAGLTRASTDWDRLHDKAVREYNKLQELEGQKSPEHPFGSNVQTGPDGQPIYNPDSPIQKLADQYKATLESLDQAAASKGLAQEGVTNEDIRQLLQRDQPSPMPADVDQFGKYGSMSEALGGGFVKGVAQQLGFGEIWKDFGGNFAKAPWEMGAFKLGAGILGFGADVWKYRNQNNRTGGIGDADIPSVSIPGVPDTTTQFGPGGSPGPNIKTPGPGAINLGLPGANGPTPPLPGAQKPNAAPPGPVTPPAPPAPRLPGWQGDHGGLAINPDLSNLNLGPINLDLSGVNPSGGQGGPMPRPGAYGDLFGAGSGRDADDSMYGPLGAGAGLSVGGFGGNSMLSSLGNMGGDIARSMDSRWMASAMRSGSSVDNTKAAASGPTMIFNQTNTGITTPKEVGQAASTHIQTASRYTMGMQPTSLHT
jgi:hypothetical protein